MIPLVRGRRGVNTSATPSCFRGCPRFGKAISVRRLPNSQLVHPDAGHGGVFQFHDDFVKRALEFL
jgi:hypothetical protein